VRVSLPFDSIRCLTKHSIASEHVVEVILAAAPFRVPCMNTTRKCMRTVSHCLRGVLAPIGLSCEVQGLQSMQQARFCRCDYTGLVSCMQVVLLDVACVIRDVSALCFTSSCTYAKRPDQRVSD
jgi:hypothetical protein